MKFKIGDMIQNQKNMVCMITKLITYPGIPDQFDLKYEDGGTTRLFVNTIERHYHKVNYYQTKLGKILYK